MNLNSKIDIKNITYNSNYIGKGSFGKVFIKNLSDFGDVAIKRVYYINEDDFMYFENEFRILKLLSEIKESNNYTPKFHGYCQDNNLKYFIFEALDINLFQYQNILQQNKFYKERYIPLEITKNISMQILNALNFLHGNEIVHCDLKPDNIVFCDDISNRIKIIDFGLAKKEGEIVHHKVQTPNYRAPEVWLKQEYGSPIDIWSFGAILYEMLIGNLMFDKDDDNLILDSIFNRYGKFEINEKSIEFDNKNINDNWELIFKDHPNYNESAIDLIRFCMEFKIKERFTADMAIFHKFYHLD